jgi:hypothetical protein
MQQLLPHQRQEGASLHAMSTQELKKLSSSYKCRIAQKRAGERDYETFLRLQRELSRRL